MALLTPISLAEARALGARYGLDVAALHPIMAGSVNTNVELILAPGPQPRLAGGGRAFLRVYEEQTAATARDEARLLAHLAGHGVKTPCPLPLREGGFIGEHAGKPTAAFPWISGDSLCQARVTPAAAAQVGEALARVHLAGASYPDPPPTRFGPPQLAARMQALRGMSLEGELGEVVKRLDHTLARFASRAPGAEISGLVHGDLFRDNVLWQGGEISALLDFESASRESYPFDLMVTLLAWCYGDRLDPALSRAMAQGYAAARPLPEGEAERLWEEGVYAALRFTITRITDFELRPRGVGVFKDYRRFLARGEAIAALGSRGLREMLGV
jgi:homoserine kinase type II